MTDSSDELLDLVNANDSVIGNIRHNDAYKPGGLRDNFIRAVNCFIINSKGQLWIPRRTIDKKIAPDGLDYSTGGHVAAGETYQQALVREMAEEVSLDIDPEELIYVGKETPEDTPPHFYFSEVYLYKSDLAPYYNPEDFVSYEWLYPEELRNKLLAGSKAKESLLAAVDMISAHLAEQ